MSFKRIITHGVFALAVLLATYLLYQTFKNYTLEQVIESVQAIPVSHLMMSLLMAACSYICLSFFDWMGLYYAGKPLSYPKAALASFTGLSIGHNVGFAALSSGAVRYRFYSRWGLSTEEVAKVVLYCGMTVLLGLSVLGGLVLLINPEHAAGLLKTSNTVLYILAFAGIAFPLLYITGAFFIHAPLHLWKWSFAMPDWKLAVGQVIIGPLNFIFVSACLHQLMLASKDVNFFETATAFILANIGIVITHVPGGLGVLEATVKHVLGEGASIGALVAFRVIYFIVPLCLGVPILLISEMLLGKKKEPSLENGSQAGLHAVS